MKGKYKLLLVAGILFGVMAVAVFGRGKERIEISNDNMTAQLLNVQFRDGNLSGDVVIDLQDDVYADAKAAGNTLKELEYLKTRYWPVLLCGEKERRLPIPQTSLSEEGQRAVFTMSFSVYLREEDLSGGSIRIELPEFEDQFYYLL